MGSLSRRSFVAPGVRHAAGSAAPGTSYARTAQLVRRLAQLERSNARLGEFAHLTAHDLQEPLATIALFVGTLKNEHADALDPSALRLLRGIEDGVVRMRATIDGALTSAEGPGAPHAVVDMNRVVDQSLRALDARRRQTAAVVSVDPLPAVHGDQTELVRLMQNLIGNALKFTAGSPRPRIWLSARSEDGLTTFSVRDNGTGVSPKRAAGVFERFERRDPPDTLSGSGFGLRIARQIVEDHGGSIWIRPSSRGGTVVCFTLFCAGAMAAALGKRSRQHAS